MLAASAVVAGAVGLVVRVHLLQTRHLDGDEAVAGIMSTQILHGHFFTFFWGNQYGGAEIYVVAAAFWLFGATPMVLNATASAVTAVAAVALWRVGRRLTPSGRTWPAVVAAEVFWIWPSAAVWDSAREFGFREVTMAAGVGSILLAIRLCERPSPGRAALLGVVVGLGWWSSPEMVYFAVPVAVIVAGTVVTVVRSGAGRTLGAGAPAAGGGFVVGALPWLWTNAHTGLASLSSTASPAYTDAAYTARLHIFAHLTLPMMLGLRLVGSGTWVGGRVGPAVEVAAVAAVAVAGVADLRPGDSVVRTARVGVVAGAVAFPFAYAAFPATSYWQDGHYGVFVVPLVLLVLLGCVPAPRPVPVAARHRAPGPATGVGVSAVATSIAVAAVVVGAAASTAVTYRSEFLGHRSDALLHVPSDPQAVVVQSARLLEAAHLRFAYADYWQAYPLDFVSGERLAVTDPSADRWVALDDRVMAAPDPAWIFYAPSQVAEATSVFGSVDQGPFAYTEGVFVAELRSIGVGWRTVHAGVLVAILPARTVTPAEVGMGRPAYS